MLSNVAVTYLPVFGVEVPQHWSAPEHSSVAHEDPAYPAYGAFDDSQAAAKVDSRAATSSLLSLSQAVLSA
jgi:hypothetical protein